MAKDSNADLDRFFRKFGQYFDSTVPAYISNTAREYYRNSFSRKAFDGKPWPAVSKTYRPKRGSLMVRTSKLMNSIKEAERSPDKVVIAAGNSKVPYARIHNEGGVIKRGARSETFIRTRNKKTGKFSKIRNRQSGQGFSFRKSSVTIPQRQYMGYAKELNLQIIARIKANFKFK